MSDDRDIEVLTQDYSAVAGGAIVRRYVNARLVAERGPDYSLGEPVITDEEYGNIRNEFQWKFLERERHADALPQDGCLYIPTS